VLPWQLRSKENEDFGSKSTQNGIDPDLLATPPHSYVDSDENYPNRDRYRDRNRRSLSEYGKTAAPVE